MSQLFYKLFAITLVIGVTNTAAKSPCEGCRDLVDGLLKGLDKTVSKNFGGGDVDWEEKRKLKYKTSELRLVEIVESACPKDNFQCNKILEEHEEEIEQWYKKLDSEEPLSLHEFLCIDSAKVCCPDDTFGQNCEACPKGESDSICFGRGKCEGAGDKQGTGKCICEPGYTGEFCNQCAEKYFKSFSNDTYILCTPCHDTCQSCTGPNATECETCRAGYREEHDIKQDNATVCVDVNECVEQRDLCPAGQYCANTVGSYSCQECSETCTSCFGPSTKHCYECKIGCLMRAPYFCQDIDECASGAVCLGMYEVCINTVGHYKCDCARFFKRDAQTGQCQPDPAIYSRYLPTPKQVKKVEETEEKKEEEKKDDEEAKVEEEKKEEL